MLLQGCHVLLRQFDPKLLHVRRQFDGHNRSHYDNREAVEASNASTRIGRSGASPILLDLFDH